MSVAPENAEAVTSAATRSVANTRISVRTLIVLGLVALAVYCVDQVAKALVVKNMTEGQQVPVLGQLLQFHYLRNPGAAFSIGSGSTWIFTIIAVGVLCFIVWYARKIRSVGWAVLFGLLLGGLLGNLTDRLIRPPGIGRGEVVDFLQIPLLPAVFNLADTAIVTSMALFLILTLRGISLDGTRHVSQTGEGTAEAEQHEAVAVEPSAADSPAPAVPNQGGPIDPEHASDPKRPVDPDDQ